MPSGDSPSKLRDAQLRLLLGDVKTPLLLNISVVLVAWLLLYEPLKSIAMDAWMFAIVVTLVLRSIFCVLVSRDEIRKQLPDSTWARIYLCIVGLGGLVWGALILFWSPQLPDATQLQLFLFPVALSASAVSALGAWFPIYLTFLLPCLLPVVGTLLVEDTQGYAVTALPAFAFFAALILMGRQYQAKIRESIQLRLTNQCLVDDLSEQNELLRKSKDQAETASRVKGEFLARVSHELRTPMNGVLGPIQLLQSTNLTAQQNSLTDTINTSAESLLNIINDVLDLSEADVDKLELNIASFAPQQLLNSVLEHSQVAAHKKGLRLTIELDPTVPQALQGDYKRLLQVLDNLTDNAVKFTSSGFVAVKLRLLEQKNSRIQFEFSVSDSGEGIATEHRTIIFDSFSQADNTSTRDRQGAGLGLTVAQQLIRLMGGNIRINSELGQGSTFSFNVWLEQAQMSTGGCADDADTAACGVVEADVSLLDGASILLVEDSEINQVVATALLENMGCDVSLAENGQEAVEALEKECFDLVLMDCQMPVMDGYVATQRIRKLDQNHDVKIVALTANAMKGDREKCLQAGMDDYLSKPFKAVELERIIGQFVKKRSAGSELTTDGSPGEPRRNINHRRNITMSAENTEKALDPTVLENLRLLDKGKGLICRVIDAFNGSVPNLMADLEAGIDAQSQDQISMPAHSMKSSAANLGAMAFSRQCSVIETMAREGKLDSVAAEFATLQTMLQPVMAELADERAAAEARKAA